MAIEAISHVFKNSKQRGSGRLLLLAIADSANGEDWSCYPGVEYLADKVLMSERYVQLLVKKLCESKELEVDYGDGVTTNGGTTNRYYILENGVRHKTEYRSNRVNHSSPGVVNHSSPGVVNHSSPDPLVLDPLVVTITSPSEKLKTNLPNSEGNPKLGAKMSSPSSNALHGSEEPDEGKTKRFDLEVLVSANCFGRFGKIDKKKLKPFSERYRDDPLYVKYVNSFLKPQWSNKIGDKTFKDTAAVVVMKISEAEHSWEEYKRANETENHVAVPDDLIPDDLL